MEQGLSGLVQPGSASTAERARRESELMRSVNGTIRRLSVGLDDSEQVAFFCECRASNCFAPAFLSVASFDPMVAAQSGWVLLPGHEPSIPWMPGVAVS
jgi:hypothetical protein